MENDSTFIANFVVKEDEVGLNSTTQQDINISIYPNPTINNSLLSIKGLKEDANIVVIDQSGSTISKTILAFEKETMEIETSSLASGVYYIRIETTDYVTTKKLIKR